MKNAKGQLIVTVTSLQMQDNSTGHGKALSSHAACGVLNLAVELL